MIYPRLKQYHQDGFDGAGVSIAILDTGISQQYLATMINKVRNENLLSDTLNIRMVVDCTLPEETSIRINQGLDKERHLGC